MSSQVGSDDLRVLCLTGGSCSGKTTALSILQQKIPQLGASLLTGPEVASMIFGAGIRIEDMVRDPIIYRQFQVQIARTILGLEDRLRAFARLMPGPKRLLVLDRGVMDGMAYMGPGEFEGVLADVGLTLASARDDRYDTVCHLVSAADGAEAHFNHDNPHRYESLEDARLLDARTKGAWVGRSRRYTVIPNVEDGRVIGFDEKMDRVLREACLLLGLPVPLNVQHKYLLTSPPDVSELPAERCVLDIEQQYLTPAADGAERRIRCVRPVAAGSAGGAIRTYAEKRDARPGVRVKVERPITSAEFAALAAESSFGQRIVKRRTSFLWENRYYHLDEIHSPRTLTLLEVDLTEGANVPQLPPFIRGAFEVTKYLDFRNAQIANAGA